MRVGKMKKLIFHNINDFELAHIFECGQCFRWKKEEDASYTGVTKFGVMNVSKKDKDVFICGEFVKNGSFTNDEEYVMSCVREYFDLDTDYLAIKSVLKKGDMNMKNAIKFGYGIRILNQDAWEMLISYIISAANNIPRISKTIENISMAYGQKIDFNGKDYYLFPTSEELSKATVEDLRQLNLGFRDKYVYHAAVLVESGKIDLEQIMNMDYRSAKRELMKIDGVGEKVADCILLFSMKKREAFPVDTWIKKVMEQLYDESRNLKKISKFAEEKFGQYGGIAQQYLFYYMREVG
ncbi:MAG: 8-oxoguanine DNA glycosylase [Clostridia bacterium]|nr:8-oxoguanine DNA glycosylase [Clostridia bacterium]